MAENAQQARQTAYIVGTDEINSSEYIVSEGEWEPNYMLIRGIKVSRVSMLGVVVAVDMENDRARSFAIDDGRGSVSVRIFDNAKIPSVEVGDIVLVIGRPRVFNEEKYIVPEIVRIINENDWLQVRKLILDRNAGIEIKKAERKVKPVVESVQEKIVEEHPVEDAHEKKDVSDAEEIIALIRKFDFGNGADTEEVIKNSKAKNTEKLIMSLLNEGEIFEVRAGRLKVLE